MTHDEQLAAKQAVIDELVARMLVAENLLLSMIDGGEECSGKDTELTHIAGILQGNFNHLFIERAALKQARGE